MFVLEHFVYSAYVCVPRRDLMDEIQQKVQLSSSLFEPHCSVKSAALRFCQHRIQVCKLVDSTRI